MRSLMNLLVVLVVVVLSANFAFAAGGLNDSDYLSGNITYDGISVSHTAHQDGDSASAWFSMSIYPLDVDFSSGSWSFYSYTDNPAYWQATCSLYFLEDYYDIPHDEMNTTCTTNIGGVRINEHLSLSTYTRIDTAEEVLSLHGSFSVYPSEVTSASFSLYEQEQVIYYMGNDPVMGTALVGKYYVTGHFLADTPEGAAAMGAPFVQQHDVPEPTGLVMLIAGAIATLIRRRKRS